jgi:hypothetical protein
VNLNKPPGAPFLPRGMAKARVIALLVTLAFATALALPAGTARVGEVEILSQTAGGSLLIQESPRYRPRRRRRTRRRNNRNPVVRVITAPYRGAKAAGKGIGRGVRRLFGRRSRNRSR